MNVLDLLDEQLQEQPVLQQLPWGVKALMLYGLISVLWIHGLLLLKGAVVVGILGITRNMVFLSGYVWVGIALWQLRKTADGWLLVGGIGYILSIGILGWITYQWSALYAVVEDELVSGIWWWLVNGPVNHLWFQSLVKLLIARCLVLRYPYQAIVRLAGQWLAIGAVVQVVYGLYFQMHHQVAERSDGHWVVFALLIVTLALMVRQWRQLVPYQRKVLVGFFVFNAWLLPSWYVPYIPKEAATFAMWSWVGIALLLYWSWQAWRGALEAKEGYASR